MSSVWDKAIAAGKVKTPKSIIEQIGQELFEKSGYLLRGVIYPEDEVNNNRVFNYNFFVKSEGIRYSYNIFNFYYGIGLYPVYISVEEEILSQSGLRSRIAAHMIEGFSIIGIECNHEEEFISIVGKILETDRVVKIVQSILSQSE